MCRKLDIALFMIEKPWRLGAERGSKEVKEARGLRMFHIRLSLDLRYDMICDKLHELREGDASSLLASNMVVCVFRRPGLGLSQSLGAAASTLLR